MTRSALTTLLLPLFALAACQDSGDNGGTGSPADPRPPQNHAWVIFDEDTVLAEVADDDQERQQGLMGVQNLPAGEGMIFVFEDERTRSFWMKDTVIPLDIAYLDATQVIVDIQQMEPLDESYHQSLRPAMFALEVPQGWFAQEGIEVGDAAEIVFGRR